MTHLISCFLLLILAGACTTTSAYWEEEEEEWDWKHREQEEWDWEGRGKQSFLLEDSVHVIKTDAGYMKVVRHSGGWDANKPMHIGFITMEPKSLFVPQYMDSSLIIFVRRGEAKLGVIYKNELSERRLKRGDIYRISAGSPFYLVNTGEGQRLHIICSIDPSESIGTMNFQSFFIGGGTNPPSVLSGFGAETLATAFNVTVEELRMVMSRQKEGPITFLDDSLSPGKSKKEKPPHLDTMMEDVDEQLLSWRKLWSVFIGKKKGDDSRGKSPDSFNIYDKRKDFSNNYGWSVAVDGDDYKPLKHAGIGVYLVNLTAGSMMTPHWNPRATEYGVVLGGSGTIEIVHPNGTKAFRAEVREGDVFWVPRYFPFCQIASRTGPFEFFGFSTSARKNRPQFLAGANSVLRSLIGAELAAVFGLGEEELRSLLDAQRESVILPSAPVSPPGDQPEEKF